jgi:hypothetical protein
LTRRPLTITVFPASCNRRASAAAAAGDQGRVSLRFREGALTMQFLRGRGKLPRILGPEMSHDRRVFSPLGL